MPIIKATVKERIEPVSNLSVKVTTDTRSCAHCDARNYDATWSGKKVTMIFEVRIGSMVNAICPACLRKLAEDSLLILDAVAAITDVPMEEPLALQTDDDKPPFDL